MKESSRPLILSLHHVGAPPRSARIRGLFTTPSLLSFQLRWLLRSGYTFTTLSRAFARPDRRTAVVTFDDGYRDNLTAGLPVLEELGIPATVFVITGDVGKRGVTWSEAGDPLPSDMLGWDDLALLQSKGWEVGSHADQHIHLARHSPEVQLSTISSSIDAICKNLGSRPRSFAYPYGSYDETTKRIVSDCGFELAVTARSGVASGRHQESLLELSRIPIGGRRFYHFLKCFNRTRRALGGRESALRALDLLLGPSREGRVGRAEAAAPFYIPADSAEQ
ncbi:MAG: polysaccharide deacetylase family protein [Pyrinomonadaceae bacterium]